ncbi:unnamed protein product [Moneuplotes crassus]|uniref:Uncharacterized protein n=1 Tax=Euplotes crassus TaxID=5936 RepID=A0AAD1XFB9_EUPCR|nr:unnamed protein product [Moneuplotes crassus]
MENLVESVKRDNTRIAEVERMTSDENNQVEEIVRSAYYFRCFRAELDYLDSFYEYIIKKVSHMNFKFNRYLDKKFIEKTHFLESLTTDNFNLLQVKAKNKNYFGFLDLSYPQQITYLSINSNCYPSWSISNVLKSITKISPRVLNEIQIFYFKINAPQFKRIMASYKHVQRININCCKLSIPSVLNFSQSLRNTKIKKLDFCSCGNSEFSDWKSNPQEFINLIQGLASIPDLKQSLQSIYVGGCCVCKNQIKDILDKYELNDVNIFT